MSLLNVFGRFGTIPDKLLFRYLYGDVVESTVTPVCKFHTMQMRVGRMMTARLHVRVDTGPSVLKEVQRRVKR